LVKVWFFREQIRVIFRFYLKSWRFAVEDLALSLSYFFQNPYTVCRRYFQKRGEDNCDAYGETSLTLWAEIAEWAEITKKDHLIDLGCGRGRLCLWTHHFIGCSVLGIDWIDTFIKKAKKFERPNLQFSCERILDAELKKATFVYLYTFHPDEENLNLSRLPAHAKVISVSEPVRQNGFFVQKSMRARFPWGEADVFLNNKRNA
jgi:hypothetical protein